MKVLKLFGLTGFIWLLSGCESITPVTGVSPKQESVSAIEQAIENNQSQSSSRASATVSADDLLPPISLDQLATADEERFDLSAEALPAREFFMGLVQGTDYNMLVHEGVTGSLTMKLKNVTVAEVMRAAHEVYGYEYRKLGNLYQVIPAEMETQIYQVNYLDVARTGQSDTQVSAGSVRDADDSSSSSSTTQVGTRITTNSETDFWGGLQDTLSAIIGQAEGRRIVVTPQTGVVVVRALPSEQDTIRDYLERAELILKRQVIIEAKILEVELSNGYQAGIDWNVVGEPSDGKSISIGVDNDSLVSPEGIGGIFSAALNLGDFTALIELLGSQGDVQVLSSPRVSTINSQKAVIKVGTDEFFVTDVENTTTTGTSTTTSPDIELNPFFSGIALDVTPQISPDGEIILHIHPTVSEVSDQQKQISIGTDNFDIPLARSTIRETDSIVRARSGQVIVIGGLMKATSSDSESETPGFSDLPGVGKLFQQRRQSSRKSELVILLRPVIADDKQWQRDLQNSLRSFQQLQPYQPAPVPAAQ